MELCNLEINSDLSKNNCITESVCPERVAVLDKEEIFIVKECAMGKTTANKGKIKQFAHN